MPSRAKFRLGDDITQIKRPGEFIRFCVYLTDNSSYGTMFYDYGEWRSGPKGNLIDLYSASAVKTCWAAASFRTRKKLIGLLKKGGPLYLVDLCFQAISGNRKKRA